MIWSKLNTLVPEPKCRIKDGVIYDWTDTRPQPTMEQINAVTPADISAAENQEAEDNFNFTDVMKTIAKALHNHENRLRALEGKPDITLRQVVSAIRKL